MHRIIQKMLSKKTKKNTGKRTKHADQMGWWHNQQLFNCYRSINLTLNLGNQSNIRGKQRGVTLQAVSLCDLITDINLSTNYTIWSKFEHDYMDNRNAIVARNSGHRREMFSCVQTACRVIRWHGMQRIISFDIDLNEVTIGSTDSHRFVAILVCCHSFVVINTIRICVIMIITIGSKRESGFRIKCFRCKHALSPALLLAHAKFIQPILYKCVSNAFRSSNPCQPISVFWRCDDKATESVSA